MLAHMLKVLAVLQESAGGGGSDLLETPSMSGRPALPTQAGKEAPNPDHPQEVLLFLASRALLPNELSL